MWSGLPAVTRREDKAAFIPTLTLTWAGADTNPSLTHAGPFSTLFCTC